MKLKNYIVLILLTLLLIFVIQNTIVIELKFLFWVFETYLSVVFLICFLLGFITHWVFNKMNKPRL